MVPQGGAHTHMRARAYDTYTHAYTGSSFGLYLSPEVQESAAYIYIGVYNIYMYLYVYKTINFISLSLYIYSIYIYLSPSLLQTSLSASRFRGWPSWPAFTARARSEYHRLWNSLSKLMRARAPSAEPRLSPLPSGETTRKSAADCNQPSLRTSA